MEINKIRLIHPLNFRNQLRNSFLMMAANIEPKPFEELRINALPLFLKAEMTTALSPFSNSEFCLKDFEQGEKNINGKIKILREYLILWQQKWGLIENDSSDKWVIKWLIWNVLDYWANNSKHVAKRHLFRSIGEIKGLPSPPKWEPEDFVEIDLMTNAQYIVKSAPEYIESVLNKYRKQLKAYCSEIEHLAKTDKWIEKEEVSDRNLFWTVESQIIEKNYSDIAGYGKVELSKRIKRSGLINPSDVTFDDLDIDLVSPSTVKRAVERTLENLGLQPRLKKRGRKKGKREVELKKQFLE